MIYLDNAATTQMDERVLNAMVPYMKQEFGNPGTMYALGMRAREAVKQARGNVAKFIKAKPEQIVFTSGGTESNNMAFFSVCEYLMENGLKHIVTSKAEHDSVLGAAKRLQELYGFDVTYLDVDSRGRVSPESVAAAIREDTGLVSIMHTNNETGAVNPIEEIGLICDGREVLFHTDCVQAAGSSPIDVNEFKCDLLSLSSHKIHGPKGVGALFIRDRYFVKPMIAGGHSQEFGLRGGTENVAGIVGFGCACLLANGKKQKTHCVEMSNHFLEVLRRELEARQLSHILHLNGGNPNAGKILNLRFDNVDGETLLLMLGAKGVYVSAGSACRSHESEPSRTLLAMGISLDDARSSVRVSFSRMNTMEEVAKAAEIVADCACDLYRQFEVYSQWLD